MAAPRKYSADLRQRATRMALNTRKDPASELYKLLLADTVRREFLEDRLAEIGYDLEWLDARVADYDAKWDLDAPSLEPANVDDFAMPVEHALPHAHRPSRKAGGTCLSP